MTPRTAACQASLSFTISRSLLKLICIELVVPSNHLILCQPLLLLTCWQHQGLFHWVGFSHQVGKGLEVSFSISPSSEYSGLISFRIDGLISLLSKGLSVDFSSITIQKHQFFGVQPSLCSNSQIRTWLHFLWHIYMSFDKWQVTCGYRVFPSPLQILQTLSSQPFTLAFRSSNHWSVLLL